MFENFQKLSSVLPQSLTRHSSIDIDPTTLGFEMEGDIEKMKAKFLGLKLSDDGKKYIPDPKSQRIANETGTNMIIGLYETYLTKANATTNLDREIINDICRKFGLNLTELICSRYEEWEISKDFLDFAIDTPLYNLFSFLLKAKDDKQRGFIYNKTNPNEIHPHPPISVSNPPMQNTGVQQ